MSDEHLRIGQAADLLDVSVDTLRRWDDEGLIAVERSEGGQRLVPVAEVRRLLAERGGAPSTPPIVASSARNTMPGIITAVTRGDAVSTVEIQAGPFRLMSILTTESVDTMPLAPGTQVVASVKSTNVVVGLPR